MAARESLSETEILALIARLQCSRKNLVPRDDIALFKTGASSYAGSDSMIAHVHYKPHWLSAADIAYKLFARNWSDFLCKGIQPSHALLNLNLEAKSASAGFIRPFLRELDRLMTRFGVTLVGGDISRSRADVFTMTLIGNSGRFIPRRNKAVRAGDLVLQWGPVGGSDFARKLLSGKKTAPARIRRFFTRPQIREALPPRSSLKAALDQSDSVAKTLGILAYENAAVLQIDVEKIQVSHPGIQKPGQILTAAEDLAVFAIAGKPSSAFRVIGHIESCGGIPDVVYRHRGQPFVLTASGDKRVFTGHNEFEHFYSGRR